MSNEKQPAVAESSHPTQEIEQTRVSDFSSLMDTTLELFRDPTLAPEDKNELSNEVAKFRKNLASFQDKILGLKDKYDPSKNSTLSAPIVSSVNKLPQPQQESHVIPTAATVGSHNEPIPPFTSVAQTKTGENSIPITTISDSTMLTENLVQISKEDQKPLPEHDLSQITRVEDFVTQIPVTLQGKTNEQLTEILASATQNWVAFDADSFGIKLPQTLLSSEGHNNQGEKVTQKDSVDAQRVLVANVAAELYVRRAKTILELVIRQPNSQETVNPQTQELALNELKKLKGMGDILFEGTKQNFLEDFKNEVRTLLNYSPSQADDGLIKENLGIVSELSGSLGSIVYSTDIARISVSKNRVDQLTQAMVAAIRKSSEATNLDLSIMGQKDRASFGGFNEENQEQWISKLQQFIELNKQ